MTKDQLNALAFLIGELRTSEDEMRPQSMTLALDVSTPAQRLRRKADELEMRDKLIGLARQAVTDLRIEWHQREAHGV